MKLTSDAAGADGEYSDCGNADGQDSVVFLVAVTVVLVLVLVVVVVVVRC